ncbi:MAG: hypothetical protein P9X24_11315 [Candidatus Hatepunaea meridiana]|nr:hypothetical protein [Candidatus Hatepunaea meridiana]
MNVPNENKQGWYLVKSYDGISSLKSFLSEEIRFSEQYIDRKEHINYLEEYLEQLHASMMVIEKRYVDQGFLDDHAEYYIRCFHPYDKFCIRIHFFRELTQTDFDFKSIFNQEAERRREIHHKLDECYLGFIVIKPIPDVFLGRTCLKTYADKVDNSKDERFYISKKTNVCLFGFDLTILSIPFQEQDLIISRCATSALWSTFHKTSEVFQHWIPSPIDITRFATEKTSYRGRLIPNRGLTIEQISCAIREIGLEPHLFDIKDNDLMTTFDVKGPIYAYLKADIPVLMGVLLFKGKVDKKNFEGHHAITITGFRTTNTYQEDDISGFLQESSSIIKLYAHDDQIGPYARMEFQNGAFSTTWFKGTGIAVPTSIIVPVDKLIRISYKDVIGAIRDFDIIFEALVRPKLQKVLSAINYEIDFRDKLRWDIYLAKVGDLKREILNNISIDPERKHDILVSNMPKFLWVAKACSSDYEVFTILIDATDFPDGHLVLDFIEHVSYITNDALRELIKNDQVSNWLNEGYSASKRIFDWMKEQFNS